MGDRKIEVPAHAIKQITPELKAALNEAKNKLKSSDRRQFMAQIVLSLGAGGQRCARRELGWNRNTIIKGTKELNSGIVCIDNFSARGRRRFEDHLPHLLDDIKAIVEPVSQVDPIFRTDQTYCPLTAGEVRRQLIEEKNYSDQQLPKERTIRSKLNQLGFKPQKVAKSKPKKKIAQVDAIFDHLHFINSLADISDAVLRLSIDTKATIKIGPYSRGGYNRHGACGADHDFEPVAIIKLFGIFNPQIDENHFYFTTSNVTADFMVDALNSLWPRIKQLVDPHTIVINADNGPENSSRRTQFIKRIVEFAQSKKIDVCLAYYPPYHSKYNPVERVWGVLEKHWNGKLLDSIDKVIGLAKTMKWKSNNAFVQMFDGIYNTGVRLIQSAMNKYENILKRKTGLEKWFVDILCYNQ